MLTAAVGVAPVAAQGTGSEQDSTGPAVEEIIVTARKVEENVQDVPIAITAFTAEEIARRNLNGIGDLVKDTAGVSFENYSGGTNPAIIIRGLAQTLLADRKQNVATFVDGIHVRQQGNVDFGLLELERVEILKGPQNSPCGRSAIAGAVNYVPKGPRLGEWDLNITLTAGSDERREVRGSVSIPLLQDKLAVRLYSVVNEFDATWANRFPSNGAAVAKCDTVIRRNWEGSDGNLGGYDNEAWRAAVTFQPIEALTIDAACYRSKVRNEFGANTQIRPNGVT